MSSPRYYLYGPSAESTRGLGLSDWYDWFASRPRVSVLDSISDLREGTLVSFNPLKKDSDAFPELKGRVDRWICIDDTDSVTLACSLAKKHEVERLLHRRLVDEMESPVIPSAILQLEKLGIWLSNTNIDDNEGDAGNRPIGEEDSRRLVVIRDEAFVREKKLDLLITLLQEALSSIGWAIEFAEPRSFQRRSRAAAKALIVTGESDAAVNSVAKARKLNMDVALWEEMEISPLRFAYSH